MLIIVATGVYALLLKFLQKSSPRNVQTNGGGGVRGFLKKVKTNCTFLVGWLPLVDLLLPVTIITASSLQENCSKCGRGRRSRQSWTPITNRTPSPLKTALKKGILRCGDHRWNAGWLGVQRLEGLGPEWSRIRPQEYPRPPGGTCLELVGFKTIKETAHCQRHNGPEG